MKRELTQLSIEFRIGGRIIRLPLEIIEEILSRLPVKSLLKFRCVSKSWRSLIDSECFIKIQLKNSTSISLILNPVVVYSGRLLEQCSWQSLFNEPVINSISFDNLNNVHWNFLDLVGCCNGLVCILVDKSFYLWNPSTRESKKLPQNSLCDGKLIETYGFGYDESCNDYKVFCNFCSEISIVYSLRSNCWKTLINDWDSLPYEGSGKFACGNLHWIIEDNDVDWNIVSFDLKREVCGFVELPSCPEGSFIKTLGVIKGCLSVVYEFEHTIDVWVMRKYKVKESWVKVATLPNTRLPREGRLLSPLCWGPNGEILIVYVSVFKFHNSEDNGNPRRVIINPVSEADVYVESLVSLE